MSHIDWERLGSRFRNDHAGYRHARMMIGAVARAMNPMQYVMATHPCRVGKSKFVRSWPERSSLITTPLEPDERAVSYARLGFEFS